MPNIGPLEIAIVLIIALIVFGPKRLPELGKSLGRGINEFRDGINKVGKDDDDDEDDDDGSEDDQEPAALTPPPGTEPEVTEIVNDENRTADDEPEQVEAEVVRERQD
ncbi:MAG: twin-arginine translocase TatA/TatE family subunit [Thermoleophilia bacterium]|nr:twin-arginine translocase TatA/TatE family subunit [Thermoleophilia bacterium]